MDCGRAAEYAHLADLPVYLLPGNHDDRDQMRRSFPDHDWLGQEGEFIQYSVQVGKLRLIALHPSLASRTARWTGAAWTGSSKSYRPAGTSRW